jgi:hypothetical protein
MLAVKGLNSVIEEKTTNCYKKTVVKSVTMWQQAINGSVFEDVYWTEIGSSDTIL